MKYILTLVIIALAPFHIQAEGVSAVQRFDDQMLNAEARLVALQGMLRGFDDQVMEQLAILDDRMAGFDDCVARSPTGFFDGGSDCNASDGVSSETTMSDSCSRNFTCPSGQTLVYLGAGRDMCRSGSWWGWFGGIFGITTRRFAFCTP